MDRLFRGPRKIAMTILKKVSIQLAGLGCAGLLLSSLSCGSDLTPYNEIDRLRVLAVSADHPWITADGTGPSKTRLSALIANAPGTSTTTARFEWSWCPLRSGAAAQGDVGAYECAFGPRELAVMGGMPSDDLPSEFELGTGVTADLDYPLPPDDIRMICDQLMMVELPPFVSLPSCKGGFPVSVRLIVRQGSESVTAIKSVRLNYETGTLLNNNPVLGKITATQGGSTVELRETTPATLIRDTEYTLQVQIAADQSEAYSAEPAPGRPVQDLRETLVLTWFIEGGDMRNTRTNWLVNDDPSDEARLEGGKNRWTTPKTVNFEPSETWLHVVIRDGREGISTLSRRIILQEP